MNKPQIVWIKFIFDQKCEHSPGNESHLTQLASNHFREKGIDCEDGVIYQ